MLQRKSILSYSGIYLPILLIATFTISSCQKDKVDPKVQTTELTPVAASSFFAKAVVPVRGDYKIVDYGFEYLYTSSNSQLYTSYGTKVSLGAYPPKDTFSTTFNIQGLNYYTDNLYCYTRAYITNEKGTVYGNALVSGILKLSVGSIVPSVAKAGDTLTINGSNFSSDVANNSVTFNYTQGIIVSASSTKLLVEVPQGISTSSYDTYIDVHITSAGQIYEMSSTFQLAPNPISFSPKTGTWYSNITVYGNNFYGASLWIDNILISSSLYSSSSSTSFSVPTIMLSKRFKIYLSKAGIKTEVPGGYFTMNGISINPLTQTRYLPGSNITLTGINYNPSIANNFLMLGSTKILPNNNYSNLTFTLPISIAEGEYTPLVSNIIDTIKLDSKIAIVKPSITGFSISSGYPGTALTIDGKNFVNAGTSPSVYFSLNASSSITSYDSTHIRIKVPWVMPDTYPVFVNFGSYQIQSPTSFTVVEPLISSIVPASGGVGTSIIINGEGFGTGNTIYVYFGNYYTSAMSSTNTQINVKVPTGVTSGVWLVKVRINNYELQTSMNFTVP
jgi:hypothetical protein